MFTTRLITMFTVAAGALFLIGCGSEYDDGGRYEEHAVPDDLQSAQADPAPVTAASVSTTTSTSGTAPPATAPPATAPTPVLGDDDFCRADDRLLETMALVVALGRQEDRFVFGDAHGEFLEARATWRPPTPELFDANVVLRERLVELGSVFPVTGDPEAVAVAFEAAADDQDWSTARDQVDNWKSTNCTGASPTTVQALVEALAVSTLAGRSDLSELVDTVAAARCIAEGAVADIGADRYASAYGATVQSLRSELSMLGIAYDRIDAEAVAAALGACVDLEAAMRDILADSDIEPSAAMCLVADGFGAFQDLIVAELTQDQDLIDSVADRLIEVSDNCGAEATNAVEDAAATAPGPENKP